MEFTGDYNSREQSNQVHRVSNTSSKKKRERGKFEIIDRALSTKNYEELPLDWEIRKRTRKSGKSIGQPYYTFYDPVLKKQFRSKEEVKRHFGTDVTYETETNGTVTDDDGDTAGVEAMEVVSDEENIGIHEPVHEEIVDANPNVNDFEGNHAHPPLGIMQDLNELPPEAEWWENNELAYPSVE